MIIYKIFLVACLFPFALCIYHSENGKLFELCNREGILKTDGNLLTCECQEQYYTGTNCDDMRLYCKEDQCENDGTCENYIGLSTCDCQIGFYGSRCELQHPMAPFTANPRLALPHLARQKELLKMYIVFNYININTKNYNQSIVVNLTVPEHSSTEILLPQHQRKLLFIEDLKDYFDNLGLFHYDISNGPGFLYKFYAKFSKLGIYNITLSMRLSDGSQHYFASYTIEVISDDQDFIHRVLPNKGRNVTIPWSKPLPKAVLQRQRRVINQELSAGLDCSYRRRNHLVNKAETIGPYITSRNTNITYYWMLRYAFDCNYYFKILSLKDLCSFDDARCSLVKRRCKTLGPEGATMHYGESLVEINFKRSLYIKAFRVPIGNRIRILPDADEEFLSPLLRIVDSNEVRECHLHLVTLNTVPWSHFGRVVAQSTTNLNTFTTEHFIYPWLRWASAMHRYDVAVVLAKMRAHADRDNPPPDLTDYDRLPLIVAAKFYCIAPLKEGILYADAADIGEMPSRTIRYESSPFGTCRLVSYMHDNLEPVTETNVRNRTRTVYQSVDFKVFRDVFIPRMRIRMTRNFQRLATTSDIMEAYLYCKYPWFGKNDEHPPVCHFYVEKVWWTVQPEIPIASDRTQQHISSIRNLATPGQKYTFKARARWQYNRFYELQVVFAMAPAFEPAIDPVVNSRERIHSLYKDYRVCFNDPQWPVRKDTGEIYQDEPDVTSIIMKIYQERVLLGWLKRENIHSKYLCMPNFVITDAKIKPNLSAAYDIEMLDTYGQPSRNRVFLKYHRREPVPTLYAFNKWKILLDKFRLNYPIHLYSKLNRPETGLYIYCQLLALNKMHHMSQYTAESGTTLEYRNSIIGGIITELETLDNNGVNQIEQVLTLCTYAASSLLAFDPVESFLLKRLAILFDKTLFHLMKFLVKPDPVQIGIATGNIMNIINPVLRVFEEILFRVPECQTHYCDIPHQCYHNDDYKDYFAHAETKFTPMKDTARIFYNVAKSIFSILVYYVESEQEPYWWSSTRRQLSVTFLNRAPGHSERAKYSVLYAPGFRARVPLQSRDYNHALGLVTFNRNIFMEESDCRINTTVNLLMSFADPVTHRFPYFGPMVVKHAFNMQHFGTSWVSMRVISSARDTPFVTGYTKVKGITYYKILTSSRYIDVIFHKRPRSESQEVKVAFSQWRHPSVDELFMAVDYRGLRLVIPKLSGGPLLYMAVTSAGPYAFYNFSVYTTDCFTYDLDESDWRTDICLPEEDEFSSDVNLYVPIFVSCRCVTTTGIFAAQLYNSEACPEMESDLSNLYNLYMALEFDDYWPCVLMVIVVNFFIILALVTSLLCNFITRKTRGTAFYFRDNNLLEQYPYSVAVETDFRSGAGTTSNIVLQVAGTEGVSMPFLLRAGSHRVLHPGLVIYFIMTTEKSLGNLCCIRLTSDFSGSRPCWFCRSISICDLAEGQRYLFYVNRWFSLIRSDTLTAEIPLTCENMVPVKAILTLRFFVHYMREDHPIIGAILRHPRSVVSATQHAAASGAMACAMMCTCTGLVLLRNRTRDLMLAVDNALSPSTAAAFALLVALFGLVLNYIIIYLFRTASGRKVMRRKPADGPPVQTGATVYGQKAFVGDSLVAERKGGVTLKCIYRVCSQPRIGRREKPVHWKFNLYSRKEFTEEPKVKTVKDVSSWGWSVSFILIVVCTITTLILGMIFLTEDRAFEIIFMFTVALFLNIMLLEPFFLFTVSLITSRALKEEPDQTGFKHRVVLAAIRAPCSCGYTDIMKLTHIDLRRYNPAYRPLTRLEIAVRRDKSRSAIQVSLKVWPLLGAVALAFFAFYLAYVVRPHNYYFSFKSAYDVFLMGKYHGVPASYIYNIRDCIVYIQSTLYRAVRPDLCDSRTHEDIDWLADNVHKILGLPRLRQLRMSHHSCFVQDPFKEFNWDCNTWFASEFVSSRDHLPHWKEKPTDGNSTSSSALRPFEYSYELCSVTHRGYAANYPYGGYTALIPMAGRYTWLMLNSLRENEWLDVLTRAIIFEAPLYNTDANVLNYAVVLIERLPTGQFLISQHIWASRFTTKMENENSDIIFRLLTMSMLFLFVLNFILKMASTPKRIFWSLWNCLDLLLIVLSLLATGAYCIYSYYASYSLEFLSSMKGEQYIYVQYAIFWEKLYTSLVAWIVFLSLIRILTMLSNLKFFVTMNVAMDTARRVILATMVLAVFLFTPFTFSSYILHSGAMEEFSTIYKSFETYILVTIGFFPRTPSELERRGSTVGAFVYTVFLNVVPVFLTCMFIAIMVVHLHRASCTIIPLPERRKRRLAWNKFQRFLSRMRFTRR